MKIVLAGGSGQVGRMLARAFLARHAEVVILTRGIARIEDGIRFVSWDGRTAGAWVREIEGSDAIIGLAGRSVNCRYGSANRSQILESRVHSVQALGRAIAIAKHPPRVWLQASTATIYAHTFGSPHTECTGEIGGREPDVPETWRFSIEVAEAWERAVQDVGPLRHTRVVLLRSAMTMSPDRGGVFDTLLRLVRWGLGGRMGNGRQFVSWIHEADFVRAIAWLMEHQEISGPVILAAPSPLANAEFMQVLRESWGARLGLPAYSWMLEIGARVLRTETELILKSRRVYPERLLESGFQFQFSTWPEAARDLCKQWRKG